MAESPAESRPSPDQAAKPRVLSLEIKDKKQLYAVYMPFLMHGGIFVPTPENYALGDDVYLLLTLIKESAAYPVMGKVAWMTPPNATNNRMQGIGVHFAAEENSAAAKQKIEELLGSTVKSDKSTYTL